MAQKNNIPRIILQWGVVAALVFFLSGLAVKVFPKMTAPDPETYCPMGGLEAFTTYLSRGSLPCSMSSVQILMGLALAVAVILLSKLFCAYICPVGTVEDLLTRIRKSLGIKDLEIRSKAADKALRAVKYGMLFWIFYSTATASELFCKKLDPYYAVATGFKGEIVLWMSLVTLALVVVGGLFVKRFWCRYLCPLGAASNTFKFWAWLLALGALRWLLAVVGVSLPWWCLLAAFCVLGWALEVFCGKPRLHAVGIVVDTDRCKKVCLNCQKRCPYNVDVPAGGQFLHSVDCTLCGECVAACPHEALSIGVKGQKKPCKWMKWLPAALAVVLVAAAMLLGRTFELPTIDVEWGITDSTEIATMRIENLKSVKCYGSSMAFKARMEGIRGVHGVKTYVGSHTVELKYDPTRTSEEKLREQIFVPSNFRVWSPDPQKLSELKILTIRTEKMYDRQDLNFLGLQFRNTGRGIWGVDSEYDCPLVVHVYVSPDEQFDEEFFREVVENKVLAMPVHGGGVKETPLDFEFVRLEKGEGRIGISEYLHMMFDEFGTDFNGRYPDGDTTVVRKRTEEYAGRPQYIYEVANQNYEKPIMKRVWPYLSNHISREEGVIGMYVRLNKDLVPSLQIRFAAPMTAERIWELMTMPVWTITYSEDDVREEGARTTFETPGICYPYEEN